MKTTKARRWFASICFVFSAVTIYFVLNAIAFPIQHPDRLPALMYFTYQSNIFVALWTLYIGLRTLMPSLPKTPSLVSLMVTVYITVTGIVYWFVLVPMLSFRPELFTVRSVWTHMIAPVFVMSLFLFVLKGKWIRLIDSLFVVVYPIAYLAFSYWMHELHGKYTYPFLDPKNMGGKGYVWLALIGITALVIVLGMVYRSAWNKRNADMDVGGVHTRRRVIRV